MTNDLEELALAEQHFEDMAAINMAKALLKRLSVAELRVLMAHYCGGKARDFNDLRKDDLVCEIASEYAADQF